MAIGGQLRIVMRGDAMKKLCRRRGNIDNTEREDKQAGPSARRGAEDCMDRRPPSSPFRSQRRRTKTVTAIEVSNGGLHRTSATVATSETGKGDDLPEDHSGRGDTRDSGTSQDSCGEWRLFFADKGQFVMAE